MPQAARRRSESSVGQDADPIQSIFEARLDEYVVDAEEARRILGLETDYFGSLVRGGDWHPWLTPAKVLGDPRKPSAYLFWRKRIEELARLRADYPHKPGPGKWAEELRAIAADPERQRRVS